MTTIAARAEIRAGGAWALGELQQPSSVDALIQVFLELAEPIRIEAARALRKIAARASADIDAELPTASGRTRHALEPTALGRFAGRCHSTAAGDGADGETSPVPGEADPQGHEGYD